MVDEKAKDKIIRARVRLQKENPFFSYLVLNLKPTEFNKELEEKLKENGITPSMAIDIKSNLYYNAKFVNNLSESQLKGVLCFPKDTLINGLETKPIQNIKINDLIINKFGELEEVKKLFQRKIKENIFTIRATNCLPIQTTKEHPFLVKQYIKKPKLKCRENKSIKKQFENIGEKWIKANKLKRGDLIALPILNNLKEYKNITNLNEFYPNKYGIQKYTKIIKEFPINEETAFLLGLYVAEGSTTNKSIQFGFNLKKEVYLTEKIKKILKKQLKLNSKILSNQKINTISIMCNSIMLKKMFLKWCGHKAKNKQIPYFILFNKNRRILKSFLDGYCLGDGYFYKKRNYQQIATISKKLALQIQLAYLRFGKLANLYNYKRRGIYHKIRGGKPLKNLNIFQIVIKENKKQKHYILNNNKVWVKIKYIKQKKYKGMVYNLETKQTHTYTAENIIVHNCHEVLHLAFNHLIRQNKREQTIFNIATDICINDLLINNNFELPKDCLRTNNHIIKIFNKEIKDVNKKCAEQVYDEIYDKLKGKFKNSGGSYEIKFKDEDGNEVTLKGFDKHITADKGNLTEKEIKEIKDKWKKTLVEAVTYAKNVGNLPAGMERIVEELLDEKVNWKYLLYKHITNTLPYDYSYCLDKNSLIKTKNGIKKLKDIKVGNIILGYDGYNIIETKVKEVLKSNIKKKYIIYTKNGNRITCSGNHHLLTPKGFIKSKDLYIGNILLSY